MATSFADALRSRALDLGFSVVRFTDAALPGRHGEDLADYIREGAHGDMAWMSETLERRKSPRLLWPEARSAVVLGMNYAPVLMTSSDSKRGQISVYARNADYHDVLKKRLKQLARWMAEQSGEQVKIFVDTAPLMESPLAAQSGMGWIGRHTNLVSRTFGSWLFIGEILTTADLPVDEPGRDLCGRCRACTDICPTGALYRSADGNEGRIDARLCVSYLSIEYKGHIPVALRPLIGNRIYGCDECIAVCPWNSFAPPSRDPAFFPRIELTAPRLSDLLALDDAAFRQIFAGSPIKRIGRDRLVRNVLIAAGNANDDGLLSSVCPLLEDSSSLVRAMAVWACSRLMREHDFAALRARCLDQERDEAVREEWIRPPCDTVP